jgi:hippurate hydrolase
MTRSIDALERRVGEIVAEIEDRLVAIRRTLHANPELAFAEHETAALVASFLADIGIEYRAGIGKTGIAALIGSGPGRTVGIRGDMDALPIDERSGAPYASRRPGVMHACGHDAHTAIALGVAAVMARLGDDLPGRAMMIFQPAEESLNGARAMLADGLFDGTKPDVMLGYHNWPLLPAGTVGWHPDVAFASSDGFDVTITGKSGHGAHPHLAVDPVVAMAHFINEIQMIVSREIAPLAAAVVTVGRVQGGTARNQIPDSVHLEGTIRTLLPETRDHVMAALERVARGTAEGHRVVCEVTFVPGVAAVRNDPAVLPVVLAAARDRLGEERVICLPQGSMGSEDFAEYSSQMPAAHLRLGSKRDGLDTMLHRSDFDLDEGCIAVGAAVMSAAALRLMTA